MTQLDSFCYSKDGAIIIVLKRKGDMDNELTPEDIDLLLESLKYSKMNVTQGDAPYDLKREKLERIDSVTAKLRTLLDS